MNQKRTLFLAAALIPLAAGTLSACGSETPSEPAAQEQPAAAELPASVDVGIALNDKAPLDLELADSSGAKTSLAAQMGDKGIVLLLVRSADWCPYCKAQLIRTAEIADAVKERGYALASLSYDKPETLTSFAADQKIPYTMMSDQGSKLIDALGLRDPQYAAGTFASGVPRATILVLAPDGTVKAKHVSEDFKVRPENAHVLAIIDGVAG